MTRKEFLKKSFYHHKLLKTANHEATKSTLKCLGTIRNELMKIFLEQCRHCIHHYMSEPPMVNWSCDQRNPGKHDGIYTCQYENCPYVNREAL